jgi:hypothetical protein
VNFCKEEGPAERRRKRSGTAVIMAPQEIKRMDFVTERGHRKIVFRASIASNTSKLNFVALVERKMESIYLWTLLLTRLRRGVEEKREDNQKSIKFFFLSVRRHFGSSLNCSWGKRGGKS